MSEEQDKYWTRMAIEKEKQMAYDDRSPEMNRGMTVEEPMKVPDNVFETLQELADVVGKIEELTSHRTRLANRIQGQIEDAQKGFSAILSRDVAISESGPMESEGFGKPRFGF